MPKRLLVLAGPDEGRVFAVSPSDTLLVGRSRATDMCLIDPHVSRVHCQVEIENNQVVVSDFDSPGGTWVNGKRIAKQALVAGDLIRIGNTRLQFLDDEGESAFVADLVAAPYVPPALPVAKPIPTGKVAKAKEKVSKTLVWPTGLVGKKLGIYKIGTVLAKSKRGYVFHGRDIRKNQPIALKILEPAFSQDAKAVQRFVKAMKLVMKLRHPHLVTVYSAGKRGPYCWIAMEYVSGESLDAVIGRIESAGPLDWRYVLRFAIYLLRALAFAHGKKLIHRNITPHNVLLGQRPQETKLVDLMLSKALDGDTMPPLPARGDFVADVAYMPSECTAAGAVPVDARADIYGAGALLYAMLPGRPPFSGETVTELVTKIRREEPTPLKQLHHGLPDSLDSIVRRLMAKRPSDRYQSALEAIVDLEKLAKAEQVTY